MNYFALNMFIHDAAHDMHAYGQKARAIAAFKRLSPALAVTVGQPLWGGSGNSPGAEPSDFWSLMSLDNRKHYVKIMTCFVDAYSLNALVNICLGRTQSRKAKLLDALDKTPLASTSRPELLISPAGLMQYMICKPQVSVASVGEAKDTSGSADMDIHDADDDDDAGEDSAMTDAAVGVAEGVDESKDIDMDEAKGEDSVMTDADQYTITELTNLVATYETIRSLNGPRTVLCHNLERDIDPDPQKGFFINRAVWTDDGHCGFYDQNCILNVEEINRLVGVLTTQGLQSEYNAPLFVVGEFILDTIFARLPQRTEEDPHLFKLVLEYQKDGVTWTIRVGVRGLNIYIGNSETGSHGIMTATSYDANQWFQKTEYIEKHLTCGLDSLLSRWIKVSYLYKKYPKTSESDRHEEIKIQIAVQQNPQAAVQQNPQAADEDVLMGEEEKKENGGGQKGGAPTNRAFISIHHVKKWVKKYNNKYSPFKVTNTKSARSRGVANSPKMPLIKDFFRIVGIGDRQMNSEIINIVRSGLVTALPEQVVSETTPLINEDVINNFERFIKPGASGVTNTIFDPTIYTRLAGIIKTRAEEDSNALRADPSLCITDGGLPVFLKKMADIGSTGVNKTVEILKDFDVASTGSYKLYEMLTRPSNMPSYEALCVALSCLQFSLVFNEIGNNNDIISACMTCITAAQPLVVAFVEIQQQKSADFPPIAQVNMTWVMICGMQSVYASLLKGTPTSDFLDKIFQQELDILVPIMTPDVHAGATDKPAAPVGNMDAQSLNNFVKLLREGTFGNVHGIFAESIRNIPNNLPCGDKNEKGKAEIKGTFWEAVAREGDCNKYGPGNSAEWTKVSTYFEQLPQSHPHKKYYINNAVQASENFMGPNTTRFCPLSSVIDPQSACSWNTANEQGDMDVMIQTTDGALPRERRINYQIQVELQDRTVTIKPNLNINGDMLLNIKTHKFDRTIDKHIKTYSVAANVLVKLCEVVMKNHQIYTNANPTERMLGFATWLGSPNLNTFPIDGSSGRDQLTVRQDIISEMFKKGLGDYLQELNGVITNSGYTVAAPNSATILPPDLGRLMLSTDQPAASRAMLLLLFGTEESAINPRAVAGYIGARGDYRVAARWVRGGEAWERVSGGGSRIKPKKLKKRKKTKKRLRKKYKTIRKMKKYKRKGATLKRRLRKKTRMRKR